MEKQVQYNMRMSASLNRYLIRRAKREVRSKNSLLTLLIQEAKYLDPHEAKKAT